uniref:Uncharacterized protein n=1 Tax=Globodera rostochiensis TaxID=31243 RepID=A0A914GXY5_GLORO
MNSSSYSSNSSSPVDPIDSSTAAPSALIHHGRLPTGITMGSPLYSSGHSSSSSAGPNFAPSPSHKEKLKQKSQCTAAGGQPPLVMAKPRTNPSCWSIPCSSAASALFVHPPGVAPSDSAFVRRFPQPKFPVVGSDLSWPTPPFSAGPLQNGVTERRRHLFSSASEDALERGSEGDRLHRMSEQAELLEARRQIEALQRENAVMRQELDRMKRQSTADSSGEYRQQTAEAETI